MKKDRLTQLAIDKDGRFEDTIEITMWTDLECQHGQGVRIHKEDAKMLHKLLGEYLETNESLIANFGVKVEC